MSPVNYKGYRYVSDEYLAKLYEEEINLSEELYENEFLITSDGKKLRYKNGKLNLVNRKQINTDYMGKIKSRNVEQELALDLLLDDDVKLVVLTGKAGCGKTYISAQSALYKLEKKKYEQMFFTRNHVEVAKPLGALPGEVFDKIRPYINSLVDQVSGWNVMWDMIDRKIIEVEAISYLQGRNLQNFFCLVDEGQNLNKEQIKMIITRIGEGSKIVICGDLEQIASKDFKNGNNGLEYLIENFLNANTGLFGMVELQESVRSELAKLASEIL